MEDNNSSFYILAGLASACLEELTTLPLDRYSFELNALQFDAMKEMVLGMLGRAKDASKDLWSYDLQGKKNLSIWSTDIYSSRVLYWHIFSVFGADWKDGDFIFEGLEDSIIYRYRTLQLQIERDWSVENPPRHLLEKSWLRLTENAMRDGQWINERVVIRNGHPMLTNNLSKAPEQDLKKLSFKELLESRIIQCKYWDFF